jgi:diadenosine tetraphosphate (Ap4A) HIT family hydrolase
VSACPICERGEPLGIVGERATTWITTDDAPMSPGYVCVVAKRHVVEPFELPEGERAAFCDDAVDAARRVALAFRPAKLNYEIHGNTISHLHMHVIPRYVGDAPPHDVALLGSALA